jgi:hypothetical protein
MAPKTFRESGSGIEMELDKFYVLSDSASAYTATGFASAQEALDWTKSPEGIAAGAEDATIPTFTGTGFEGVDGVSIFKGSDLQAFWSQIEDEENER